MTKFINRLTEEYPRLDRHLYREFKNGDQKLGLKLKDKHPDNRSSLEFIFKPDGKIRAEILTNYFSLGDPYSLIGKLDPHMRTEGEFNAPYDSESLLWLDMICQEMIEYDVKGATNE